MRAANNNDKPDSKIDKVIALLTSLLGENAVKVFESLIVAEGPDLVFAKLRAIETTASPLAAEILTRAVSAVSNKLPPEETEKYTSTAFTQAVIFVNKMLLRISGSPARRELALIIISESPSLIFVCEVLDWAIAKKDTMAEVFSAETEEFLQQQLADRIDSYLSTQTIPIYISERKNAVTYLRVLIKAGRSDRVQKYLTDALTARPESVSDFLWAMFPNKAYKVLTGEPTLIRVFPQQYNYLSKFIDPVFLGDIVHAKFKDFRLIDGTPTSESEWDIALAQSFMALHNGILNGFIHLEPCIDAAIPTKAQ